MKEDLIPQNMFLIKNIYGKKEYLLTKLKKSFNMNNKLKYSLIGLILLILDQVTKIFLKKYIDFKIFALNPVHNTGVSFGMLKSTHPIVFILLSIVVIAVLYYFRKEFKGYELFLTLIITGILGNLIDRIFLGYVRDFLDLKWWPVFNVADSLMFIGVFGTIIFMIVNEIKEKKKVVKKKKIK